MSNVYEFSFTPDPKVLAASLRASPPAAPKVRGHMANKLLRLLHCTLLMIGGVGVGYIVSELLTGTATFFHWSTAVGLGLSYVAVFGSIFITIPTMIRQALATRANQGIVQMTVDATGVETRTQSFRSKIEWRGLEGVTRSKLGFILWLGANRPAIPFTAFDGPTQIEAFEEDIKQWLETSR